MIEIRLKKDSDVLMTLPHFKIKLVSPLQLKYALKYNKPVNGYYFKKKDLKIKDKLIVYHVDKPNEIMTFKSQYQAARDLGVAQPNISANISGKLKSVKGFIFKKVNN